MKCEHQWVKKGKENLEWCIKCGTLKHTARRYVWYDYPENLKGKKDVIKYRKDLTKAERDWYAEWSK